MLAPTLASSRLCNILATFRVRYPASVVRLKEMSPSGALSLLSEQEVEFYIGPELPNLANFEFRPALEDPLVAFIPAEYDDGAADISLSDIGDRPVILLDRQPAIRELIDRLLSLADIELNIQYEVQSTYTAKALAANGLGIAIVPQIAVAAEDSQLFRVVPIADPNAHRSIGIITARGHVQHGYSEQLIELICQNLKSAG